MKTQILLFTLFASLTFNPAWSKGGSGGGAGDPQSVPHFIEHLVNTGQFTEAQKKLKYFIRKEKTSVKAWNLLGKSQFETGALNASLQSFTKALKLDPKNIGVNRSLGELYLALGDNEKAYVHLEKLMQLCGSCDEYVALNQAISSNN
ncbi:MAG: tetratricopeptide repeat protein [Acidiferrobacterales bacterium]|nr:tetratricopeptide repeat protein [Acidiferrobacterales bacterium]